MIDIKKIILNKEDVEDNLKKRDPSISLDGIVDLEERRRGLQRQYDEKRRYLNKFSSENITQEKRELLREESRLAKELNKQIGIIEDELERKLLELPNLLSSNVPVSPNKDDYVVEHIFGSPPSFDFTPIDHVEIGSRLQLIDFDRGSKLAGTGFPVYIGDGARLEWSLINFMLDRCLNNGFRQVMLPFFNNTETLTASGNLPKFADELYYIERDKLFAIPTAEAPLTSFYRGETIEENNLPIRLVSYTPCFRREAGSHGVSVRGLMRMHQFNKVETYTLCKPEDSQTELERMVQNAEEIIEKLGSHYRTVLLPSCDLAHQASITKDVEIWLPHLKKYSEVSSASNCLDYQARRANIRYKGQNGKGFIHTLNCSALATPRLMISILESNQTREGRVIVPEALRNYMKKEQI